MKKLNILLMLSAFWGGFTSCSQDAENEMIPSTKEVNFNVSISKTRTVTNDKVTSFIENDQIGIFGVKRGTTEVLDQNVKYTYNNVGMWTADKSITFPLNNAPVNFYAYYPHGSYTTTTFDFSVTQDQSKDNGYEKSDLLLAKNEVANVGDKEVSLPFVHPMAMVEVKPMIPVDVTLTSVNLLAVKTASVDLVRQTATVKANESSSAITLMKVGDVYRAVVPMQVLTDRTFELFGVNAANQKVMFEYILDSEVILQANQITKFEITCNM